MSARNEKVYKISGEDLLSNFLEAINTTIKETRGVRSPEGKERHFRYCLNKYIFENLLGWEGHSLVGEIIDIKFFDDDNFPVIIVETKDESVRIERSSIRNKLKNKLKNQVEDLGSVKYAILTNLRRFIIYEYNNRLRQLDEFANINLYNIEQYFEVSKLKPIHLSANEINEILKIRYINRENFIKLTDIEYFINTYKQISVAQIIGLNKLIDSLSNIVKNLTYIMIDLFNSYINRLHYSGEFLTNQFGDWLKYSIKEEAYNNSSKEEKNRIIEIFCKETAYVFAGRILFTRICEDKEIITLNILSGIGISESIQYYEKINKINPYLQILTESREIIKKYYSHLHELGLFDWWVIDEIRKEALKPDDLIIQDRLEKELNNNILNVLRNLNRFDFTLVNRDILGDVYQGYLPSHERKRLGEFYTPKEIIDYILDAINYKPDNEIRGKKILDPSCGSGGFLVESVRRLIKRYIKMGMNQNNPDDSKLIIEGCLNSIYGLDIHPFACFIAETNLLFQFIDLYSVVRQKYKNYILKEINICRTDSLSSSRKPMELMKFSENSRRVSLIKENKRANQVKEMKFDYLVGNPPYVNLNNMIKKATVEGIADNYRKLIKEYREIYESIFWNFDLYIVFIERGLNWLATDGILGYICSNQFMSRYYGKNLRKFILKNSSIRQILDFGRSGVFKDATNYPCILVLEKKIIDKPILVIKIISSKKELMNDIKSHIHLNEYENESYAIFTVEQKSLNDSVWDLSPLKEIELMKKIEDVSDDSLENICLITSGIRTGRDNIFIAKIIKRIRDNIIEIKPMANLRDNKTFLIEENILIPILKGKNVRRWNILWDDLYVIYPHKKENNKIIAIKENEMQEKYNYTYQYLKSSQNILENRLHFQKGPIEWHGVWYAIMAPSNPDYFENEKILSPALTNKNNFALDIEKNSFVGGTAGVIGILPYEMKDIKYILGILNSKLYEFYLKHKTPVKAGGYFQLSVGHLKKLPIISGGINVKLRNEIIRNVEQILQLKSEINFINKKIINFPFPYFEENWEFSNLINIIEGQNLSKSSYKISKKLKTEYFKDLMGNEIFRIILSGKNYIDFSSKNGADYILEILNMKNIVSKKEIFELKIPKDNELNELMLNFRYDKEKIINKAIENLDRALDLSVYKLYNISFDDQLIIENFMKKF